MSTKGPSQRNAGIATLVYSTLGPSLSLLPNEDKSDWVIVESAEEKRDVFVPARDSGGEAEVIDTIHADVQPSVTRPPATNEETTSNTAELSNLYSNSTVQTTAERRGGRRLGFNYKSSAGSSSSQEQATLLKEDSFNMEEGTEAVSPPLSKQLQDQISKNSAVEAASSIGEEFVVQRSVSASGYIPRAPTGSERSRLNKGDNDSMGITEMLKDLDKQAGERQHRERVSSLQNDSMVGQPVSWEGKAISNRHMWQVVDTREACHLADTQYCQQLKVFHPKRQKLRCSACRALVHDTCVRQLYYEGYTCKETFREIRQKGKETVTYHHFLHRRKIGGKCKKCDRSFGSWKNFNGKDIAGISCSWCGDSYHEACFDEGLRKETCHMGPLQNLIIPPLWIVKVPQIEQQSGTFSSTKDAIASPKGSARRKTRKSRRKKGEERASKYFTVKSIAQRQHKPLLVFINPKSGGNQGARLMQTFQWLLNPRQVFDLSKGGPEFGLKMFQGVSNIRILACGGDGTAGWIFSVLDKLDIRPVPPLAILPLGTGNDLARVFGWGAGYSDEPIDKILLHVDEGPVEEMDRWQISAWENPMAQGQKDPDGSDDTPLHVINNYFSIGADAQVALEFHLEREANPERFNSRYRNKMQYTKLAGKDLFQRRFQTLTDHIRLHGDGEDLTEKVQNLRLEAICFLNIPSYGAGTNPWGNPSSRDPVFKQQQMNDGKIEIVGFWASTFPKLQVGIAHGERIAQCQHIKLVTSKAFPVQIDGEACKLQPSVIEVGLKNKAMMVRKVARRHLEAPLQGVRPSDKIKLSVSKVTSEQYERLYSDLYEIRRTSKALGLVVATPQDTLKSMRKQIEQLADELDEDGLSRKWRFLDVANSGRVDRMFQVIPDQEESISIRDMLCDGLLIVELPPSPDPTPTPMPRPSILLSPDETTKDEDHSLFSIGSATERRKHFGRNPSYERATNHQLDFDLVPPISASTNKDGLEVPPNPNLTSADSSPSETPIPSEDEACNTLLAPLPNMADTGSDSTGTDTDVIATSTGVQKALFDFVKRGNLKKVKEYESKGGQLTATDSNGLTPLHHAARLDKIEVAKYITENIPREALDIVEDEKLQTPLHKAAWYGHFEICKLLVEKGASLDRRDYQGNNAFDKSVQSANKDLQKYIQNKANEAKAIHSDELAV